MECNKDEAMRAKQIGESKMQNGDFVEALKFALKAKKLFPETQNIVQIITVYEVHTASQNKPFGSEMDWYGILQTETISTRYSSMPIPVPLYQYPSGVAGYCKLETSKPAESKTKDLQSSPNPTSKGVAPTPLDPKGDKMVENVLKDENVCENDDPSINNADAHQRKTCTKKKNVPYTEAADSCKANENGNGFCKPEAKKDRVVADALRYDFKKEKSEEKFKCDQIWAIYGGRDKMPKAYAQIKMIESTPNFRLHVLLLEPCFVTKGLRRTMCCGTFKVKKTKPQILSLSEFSHQVKVEPIANDLYEIYPRKGEVWALYKDLNFELTCLKQGRGECDLVVHHQTYSYII
ncbi:unnamed protein product [Lupinus luteus]|uniref:DUF3444 domain-containing protein n=1 Tax=Lupinus luteus TaxID=3873 RepID=A0AAV1WR38_LUPLU